MHIKLLQWSFILYTLFVSSGYSSTHETHQKKFISRCGVYYVQGHFVSTKGKDQTWKYYFLLNPKTDLQVRVEIKQFPKKFKRPFSEILWPISAHLKITQACDYECSGELIKVFKSITPETQVQNFIPNKKFPIRGGKLSCHTGI